MKLNPYVKQFLNADAGGGGGAAIAPSAPVPAQASATAAPAGQTSIADFIPPTLDFNAPNDATAPETKPDAKKPDPVNPEPKKAEAKPPAKPASKEGAPPIEHLRAQLKTLETERDDWKTRYEKHPEIDSLKKQIAERDAEAADLRAFREDAQTRLGMQSPAVQKQLADMDAAFDTKMEEAMEFIPALKKDFNALATRFARLPRGEGYADALAEFKSEISEIIPAEDIPAALGLMRDAIKFGKERFDTENTLKNTHREVSMKADVEQYQKHREEARNHVATAAEFHEDFIRANPHHPASMVSAIRASLEGAEKDEDGKFISTVDNYLLFAATGVDPSVAAGFNQPAAERTNASRQQAIQTVRQMAKKGFMYERYMPAMMQELSRLREEVANRAAAVPPDPTGGVGGSTGEQFDTVEGFKPPEIPRFS